MPAPTVQPPRQRAERQDSIRNRLALVVVARRVFARAGLGASLECIAAEAGVGIGTLYRHFPTRDDLWEAVLLEPLQHQLDLVERASENPDAWEGLASWIIASCAAEADCDGYVNLMTTRFEGAPRLREIRASIHRRVDALFDRAHDAGAIRHDLVVEDLIFITLANGRIAEVTRDIAPGAWRRNVELFLDSIRPEAHGPLSEPPMKPAQVSRAMLGQRPPPAH